MLNTFQKMMPMSFAIKMLITGFVTALGGSGYIGFLSEYATYFYAWNNGFRVPAEGSPYLKVTITSLTFLLIFSSSLIFIFSYVLFELYRRLNEKVQRKQEIYAAAITSAIVETNTNSINLRVVNLLLSLSTTPSKIKPPYIVLILGALIFVVFLIITSLTDTTYTSLATRIGISFLVAILYMVILLPLAFPKHILLISIFYAGTFLLATPFILFNQNVYSVILSQIGYGGGAQVEIQRTGDSQSYSLLLRTTDSIFVKVENKTPIEIPLSQVNSIDYLSNELK